MGARAQAITLDNYAYARKHGAYRMHACDMIYVHGGGHIRMSMASWHAWRGARRAWQARLARQGSHWHVTAGDETVLDYKRCVSGCLGTRQLYGIGMGGRGSRHSRRPLQGNAGDSVRPSSQGNAGNSMCRLMLIGDRATGKTCAWSAWRQFADSREFHHNGVDFMTRDVDLNDSRIKLQLWDTGAQAELFRLITQTY